MITAILQNRRKVISDFFNQLRSKKQITMFCCFFSSIIILVIIYFYGIHNCSLLKELSSVNISLLGIDIAAFAILIALLQDKELDKNAKDAFEEQSITFLGNAFFQLLAIIFFLLHLVFNSCFLNWFAMGVEIFALIEVFDMIIEMFTLTSLIKNK